MPNPLLSEAASLKLSIAFAMVGNVHDYWPGLPRQDRKRCNTTRQLPEVLCVCMTRTHYKWQHITSIKPAFKLILSLCKAFRGHDTPAPMQ